MSAVRVSVVVPTWNREEMLARALRSARARIGEGDEIVVVDDGSTDGTAGMLARDFPEVRRLETDRRGPGAARNAGIRSARGEYVAFLDSDDDWLPTGLTEQVEALAADPGLGLSHARARVEGGPARPEPPPRGGELSSLIDRNFVVTSTVVVPRRVLDAAGPFDEDLSRSMDRDLWMRIAESRAFHFLDRETAVYRHHGAQQIRDRMAVQESRSRIFAKALSRARETASPLVPRIEGALAYRLLRLGRERLRRGDRAGAKASFREAARIRPWSRLRAMRYLLTMRREKGSAPVSGQG